MRFPSPPPPFSASKKVIVGNGNLRASTLCDRTVKLERVQGDDD